MGRRGSAAAGDGGCVFPRGLESLNGKFNGAIRCDHKSQEGGKKKGLRTEMHTEFRVTFRQVSSLKPAPPLLQYHLPIQHRATQTSSRFT